MENTNSNMILASTDITIYATIKEIIGGHRTDQFSQVVLIPESISSFGDENVSRAQLSMSLFLILYADLLGRVPHALKYFERRRLEEQTILLDHGAVRTVLHDRNGDLPPGQESLTRILSAIGYCHNETYPLEKIKLTGRSYTHLDLPELIPQYFVSEFHPEKIEDDNFEKAVISVIEDSIDPLSDQTKKDLEFLTINGYLPRVRCTEFLANCASAFSRQHPVPKLKDYKMLLSSSDIMAWISTEGNTFNHATDRVSNLGELVDAEDAVGSPMKEFVEISKTGRVLQTAYIADPIKRAFIDDAGETIEMQVPGSFFEFIERHMHPDTNKLDLAFDVSNATGVFLVTNGDHSMIEPRDELDDDN